MSLVVRAALLSSLLLAACGDEDGGDTDRPQPGDHGDGGADGDGGDAGSTSESDCEDGADDDGDGLTDCEDDDCADAFVCSWPDAISYFSRVDFSGNTIECEVAGFEIDVDVPDCATVTTSTMIIDESAAACAQCDRTFSGTLNYSEDSCSELLETTPPTSASVGLVFVSETTRELWGVNDAGQWEMAAAINIDDDGMWELAGGEQVWDDPDDCDNGNQHLGDLTVVVSFKDIVD